MSKKRGSSPSGGGNRKSQQKQPQRKEGFLSGPRKFVRDVRGELRRVSWPNRDQLRQSTAVVLIIVVALGLYVAAWDFVFDNLSRLIFL